MSFRRPNDDRTACVYCGGDATTIDHVWPRAKGGRDTKDNRVPCCVSCNRKKGARSILRDLCGECGSIVSASRKHKKDDRLFLFLCSCGHSWSCRFHPAHMAEHYSPADFFRPEVEL